MWSFFNAEINDTFDNFDPGMPSLNEMEDDFKDFTEKEKCGLRNFYETFCYPYTLRPAGQPYVAADDDHWLDMIAVIEKYAHEIAKAGAIELKHYYPSTRPASSMPSS